jgi:hypothetical protein
VAEEDMYKCSIYITRQAPPSLSHTSCTHIHTHTDNHTYTHTHSHIHHAHTDTHTDVCASVPPTAHARCLTVATTLVRQVFASLQQMFTGAREIQAWLTSTAKEIARSKPLSLVESLEHDLAQLRAVPPPPTRAEEEGGRDGSAGHVRSKAALRQLQRRVKQGETLVVWTTPLGLPIVQPYRRRNVKQASTGACVS